jgi:hypothetical protein
VLLDLLNCLYTGEKKILLPGQAAWATAGEQQRISLTIGEGATHFVSIYLENLLRNYLIGSTDLVTMVLQHDISCRPE